MAPPRCPESADSCPCKDLLLKCAFSLAGTLPASCLPCLIAFAYFSLAAPVSRYSYVAHSSHPLPGRPPTANRGVAVAQITWHTHRDKRCNSEKLRSRSRHAHVQVAAARAWAHTL
eukprot:1147606-Pelagomonas_calceolata.AAC.2